MAVDPKSLRRGIYRQKMPEGIENSVQVRDVNGGSEMPLDESIYRDRGYEPPVETLPWMEEYFADQNAPTKGSDNDA